MLELSFTAHDLTHIRFAFSPLWEVTASVRVLKTPAEHPLHARWAAEARADRTEGRLALSGAWAS